MNLGSVGEERRLVESYKFNGWELDINSRSLISPAGEHYNATIHGEGYRFCGDLEE
ncbi:two-component response regulator [Yersinia enterocolitica]|nr:two-component response regulator [Yersinia enterocolitica]